MSLSSKEDVLEQTVELLELMSRALGELRRDLLPSQPRKFAILSQGPLEEMRRLQSQIEQLTADMAAAPISAS